MELWFIAALLATDSDGNQTGVLVEDGAVVVRTDISGSFYTEFGGSKYLLIPSNIERQTVLTGEADGGYTLTLATLDSVGETTIDSVLENATVTPAMQVTYSKDSDGYSTLLTDYDGDTVIDLETTTEGEVVAQPEPEFSYTTLREAVKELSLPRSKKRLLNRFINRAQQLHDSERTRLELRYLKAIKRVLHWYQRHGLLPDAQYQEVSDIINGLKNNAKS